MQADVETGYVESLVQSFAIWCDDRGLTLVERQALAEQIADALSGAADERSNYLPADELDPEETAK